MKRSRTALRRSLTVCALAIVFALSNMTAGHAHSWVPYYRASWPLAHRTIPYGFDNYWPLSKSGVHNGSNAWNFALGGSAPNFFNQLPQQNYSTTACNLADYTGAIHFRDLNVYGTSVLGRTDVCKVGATLHRFALSIDSSGRTWYVGTGDAPGNQYDMWSVASHEFGHATGWVYHLDYVTPGTSLCANNSGQHTMCGIYYVGTERQRTLGTHDIDTFDSIY